MAKKSKFLMIIDENNQLSQEIKDIIFDDGIRSRNKSVLSYFKKNKVDYDENSYQRFLEQLNQAVYQDVYYLAHVLYLLMKETKSWGMQGEYQSKISFCRCLLKMPDSDTVGYQHLMDFDAQLDKNFEELGLKNCTVADLQAKYYQFRFLIFGQLFTFRDVLLINDILQFCGSDCFLQARLYGKWRGCLFGPGKLIKKAEFNIVFLKQERIRTPNIIMPIAAIVGTTDIFVREESLSTIYYQKWAPMINNQDALLSYAQSDDFWNISYGIKRRCLDLYQIFNDADLKTAKKQFIRDMRETIYYHEIGHRLLSHYIFSPNEISIASATTHYGEDGIFEALSEFLSDFSPAFGVLMGPIQNMVNISKKDKIRAERMYYMYFSDVWFYDTENVHMLPYSDLMSLMMLRYIRKDLSVDFDKLEEDLKYDPKSDKNNSMIAKILKRYSDALLIIDDKVKKTKFDLSGPRDFEYIKSLRFKAAQKTFPFIQEDSIEFLKPFWTQVFVFVDKFTNIKSFLTQFIYEQKQLIMKRMLIISAGKKRAENIQFDHRKYIVKRLKLLGLVGTTDSVIDINNEDD